jgi:hypothetical protein
LPYPAKPAARRASKRPSLLAGVPVKRSSLLGRLALIGASGVVLLAGCGSSQSHSGAAAQAADPANAVPASAALFAGASVRPDGPLKTEALADGNALTHQADPYLRLLAALQTPGSPPLSFKDLEDWLGPNAGVFLSSLSSADSIVTLIEQALLGSAGATVAFPFASGGAQGAILLDTSNVGKAQAFLDAQAAHAGAHPVSYRGVSYQATTAGIAFALVARMVVIGSESAVHAVIDTSLGGASLAHAGAYSKLLAAAPAGTLGHLYSNPPSEAEGERASAQSPASLLGLLTGSAAANVSIVPGAGSLALDADTLSAGKGLLASDPEGAAALAELPGESWLAIGLGHGATSLRQDVQGLQALGALGSRPGVTSPQGSSGTSLSVPSLVGALSTPLKLMAAADAQARTAFASWMGSAGIYASGAGLLELKAAVVIASKNPALSRAAVPKLAAELRKSGGSVRRVSIPGTDAAVGVALKGLPVVLDIADGPDSAGQTKFVLGFGEASVAAALNPQSTLAGAGIRSAAATALGAGTEPSLILDVPTLLGLLEGVGLTEDPSISGFVPYLRALGTVSGGGHDIGGGVQRFRLVLGLQRSTG